MAPTLAPRIDLYHRPFLPTRIIDGDTLQGVIDDSRRGYSVERLRLLGVNTPELHDPDEAVRQRARDAAAFVEEWFHNHRPHNRATLSWPNTTGPLMGDVEVQAFDLYTQKADAFDRWLALVTCQDGHSLTAELLDLGYALVWARS